MPVRAKVRAFLDDLGEFILALLRHWIGFASGGFVIGVALASYERLVQPIPTFYYIGILFVGFLVASFLAWQEEQTKRLRAEAEVAAQPPDISALRDAQIRQSNQIAALDSQLVAKDEEIRQLSAFKPRDFTPAQRSVIVTSLLRHTEKREPTRWPRSVNVLAMPNALDGQRYADALRHAFRDGGLAVHADYPLALSNEPKYRFGVWVRGYDNEDPGTSEILVAALRAAKIDVNVELPPHMDWVEVIVGEAPAMSIE